LVDLEFLLLAAGVGVRDDDTALARLDSADLSREMDLSALAW